MLNLASAEYSRNVLPHLPHGIRVITPIFGERNGAERVVEKGVYVKMARGEMVRFLAEQGTDEPDALTEFDRLGFRCCSELSKTAFWKERAFGTMLGDAEQRDVGLTQKQNRFLGLVEKT